MISKLAWCTITFPAIIGAIYSAAALVTPVVRPKLFDTVPVA